MASVVMALAYQFTDIKAARASVFIGLIAFALCKAFQAPSITLMAVIALSFAPFLLRKESKA